MSAARGLAALGNQNTLAVETGSAEVGIASTAPSSTLDIRGEVKVGTNIQLGNAGVITASSYSGSFPIVDASSLAVSGISTLVRLAVTDEVVTGIITALGLSGNLTGAAATISGALNVDGTTDSTSVTTGALIVDGGVGIAKNVYIGAGLSVAGTLTYEDVTNVDSVGLITAKSGVNITGGELAVGSGITMTATSGVATFADGSATTNGVHFGNGDLKIYHDGSNSYVTEVGTGSLIVQANAFYLKNAAGDENMVSAAQDGAVNLLYNNTTKFSTTNDGTTTTGIGTFTGLDVADKITHTGDANTAIRFPGNDQITFETNASERLRIAAGTAGTCLLLTGDRVDSTNKTLHLTLNHYNFNTVNQIDVIGATCGSGYNRVHIGGADDSFGNTAATEIKFYTGANATTTNGSQRLRINSGGDVEFYGTAAGVTSAYWDASANSLIFKDNSKAVFGDGSDLTIYHTGTDSYIKGGSSGELVIRHDAITMQAASSTDTYFDAVYDGEVSLRYNNSKKFETTNDGVKITGIATCSNGIDAVGMLREGYNTVANKISAAPNIDIAQGNIHYFTTTETTTATPNIRYDSSYSLNNKMSAGDVLSLTIITTAAAAGYAANWEIDGTGITEEWVGGAAPTTGGSDGYDIYTLTILKLADASWKVFINVSNAT